MTNVNECNNIAFESKKAMSFYHRFLFVTTEGFEPSTLRAEI